MSELVYVALGVCLLFSFWNGFTDAAYSISTIIATRVLNPLRAIVLASVGELPRPPLREGRRGDHRQGDH